MTSLITVDIKAYEYRYNTDWQEFFLQKAFFLNDNFVLQEAQHLKNCIKEMETNSVAIDELEVCYDIDFKHLLLQSVCSLITINWNTIASAFLNLLHEFASMRLFLLWKFTM